MAIFRKRDGDTPAKGKAAADSAPQGGEAASNGASAPDSAGSGWIAKSGIPRGEFLYIARGYGPLPDED